jgi:hypothetical protein
MIWQNENVKLLFNVHMWKANLTPNPMQQTKIPANVHPLFICEASTPIESILWLACVHNNYPSTTVGISMSCLNKTRLIFHPCMSLECNTIWQTTPFFVDQREGSISLLTTIHQYWTSLPKTILEIVAVFVVLLAKSFTPHQYCHLIPKIA